MTSTEGRCVRHHDVDAGGAGHLGETLDRALDVLAGDHHQVGHLVDDDDDIGQRREVHHLFFMGDVAGVLVEPGGDLPLDHLALGARLCDAGRLKPSDVAHAEPRHLAIALLHLAHRPFERDHGLARIGDDRRQEMRDAVIDGKLQHLRVDHDQPARPRGDTGRAADRIIVFDGDRLARAGGAGDEQMRHLGEIDDHRLARRSSCRGRCRAWPWPR